MAQAVASFRLASSRNMSASSYFSLRLVIFNDRPLDLPLYLWWSQRRICDRCTCGGLNAAYDIIVRDDTQGGILIFFNFFFGRRNGGRSWHTAHIYGPYWYNDARVYQSVNILSIRSLSIFFVGKILHNTPPHPCPPSTISPLDQNSPLCNPRAIQLPWSRVSYFWIDL